jgi:cellulose 1,4-beta-cellobiosidase
MSGIGSISSGTSGSSSSLPNGGLSSVGASLLNSGAAPNPVPSASSTSTTSGLSSYQAQYLSLQAYDTQELLYASFLTPAESLANTDSVLEQAAALLDTPALGATQSTNSTGSTSTSGSTTSGTSSTSTASSALTNLPSVASILAASDDEAQQTLNAYANAPVGSSILDYQA